MLSFLLILQIFITVLMSLIIVLQNCSDDSVILSNHINRTQCVVLGTFIEKLTIILIFLFMTNSLLLTKRSFKKSICNKPISKSLENQLLTESYIKENSNSQIIN